MFNTNRRHVLDVNELDLLVSLNLFLGSLIPLLLNDDPMKLIVVVHANFLVKAIHHSDDLDNEVEFSLHDDVQWERYVLG